MAALGMEARSAALGMEARSAALGMEARSVSREWRPDLWGLWEWRPGLPLWEWRPGLWGLWEWRPGLSLGNGGHVCLFGNGGQVCESTIVVTFFQNTYIFGVPHCTMKYLFVVTSSVRGEICVH